MAEMTICGTCAISELVGCETGYQLFSRRSERVAFLWNFKVTELTENELSGTN
jgi:hypothetical protein